MSLLIKICGLSTASTMEAALSAGADMVGLVFFAPSPRTLSPGQARELGAQAQGRALKVALSVDADDTYLDAAVEACRPDLLQLHGKETPARVLELKARYGLPVMKAIHVSGPEDLAAVAPFEGAADRLIFDARPPKGAILPGGNGAAFDWAILDHVETRLPWMLSGGINPDNVAQAIAATGARGVDVSSGVERAPGVKDEALIRLFVERARAA
ncbi:MAG: phosphoribosylanthranilate isomerase [Beijerinckiaceae bacterium]|nr:phosphoribosylanthranilate isomerase [Beijerinckiaceae bacterium]